MKNNRQKIRLLLIVIIVILIIFILLIAIFKNNKGKPVDAKSQEIIIYEVKEGEDALTLSQGLKSSGIIKDSDYFYELYLEKSGTVYANFYSLSPSMSAQEVYEILNSPSSNVDPNQINSLLIYEGETVPEIAQTVAQTLNEKEEEVISYWANKNNLNSWIAEYEVLTEDILDPKIMYPLEGYLYPATYQISEDETLKTLTTKILETTEEQYSKYIKQEYKKSYTFHQILTLASIVERETMHKEDKPKVAQVFYNRIEQGMPLQSDITVLYAKGEYKADVLYEDLEYQSPYNTYLNSGLPPSPISSVSIESLDGAINPQDNNYIYFFAKQDTGEILYSETYEEHLEISEKNAWE